MLFLEILTYLMHFLPQPLNLCMYLPTKPGSLNVGKYTSPMGRVWVHQKTMCCHTKTRQNLGPRD